VGMLDVQALGTASGFKFPQVMAAMWALESGWGKYTSGKNNVFNIKARPGQGTQKNGSYWRDYPSPLESAKDFMNLMTDPRYAPGLSRAQTPRQAIEAIAAGGYAGGEAAYPSKIIRVMQQMGVNVDQVYNPAPPARNQAFMRPTLAYITGDIGPTSTGQHLDVKHKRTLNATQ
jgi:flagellum-specific peptidoglycan hydrolase FlgJ